MSQQVMKRQHFVGFEADSRLLFEDSTDRVPSQLHGWNCGELVLDADATHFGFVTSGTARLETASGQFQLQPGMYFATPGRSRVAGQGQGFVATRRGYRGFFQIGGPVESQGRLRYIDGCTDSLLIPPVIQGDPCLNLLHIPPATDQTPHTHPSVRMGTIVRGSGLCRTPGGDHRLTPGLIFLIPTNAVHSFHTQDDSLLIIAWHPDSDFGPTHEVHPMLNRTIVNGRSLRGGNRP